MIMLFKDCKFKGKKDVRKTMKEDIMNYIKKSEIPYSKCNEGFIYEYIDLLLDETQYDIKQHTFYYKVNWVKINIGFKILSNVALDYIREHLDEFLLEEHKPTI